MVIDGLLRRLSDFSIFARAYTNNVLILVRADDKEAATLCIGHYEYLSVIPTKVKVVPFRTRTKLGAIEGLSLRNGFASY